MSCDIMCACEQCRKKVGIKQDMRLVTHPYIFTAILIIIVVGLALIDLSFDLVG